MLVRECIKEREREEKKVVKQFPLISFPVSHDQLMLYQDNVSRQRVQSAHNQQQAKSLEQNPEQKIEQVRTQSFAFEREREKVSKKGKRESIKDRERKKIRKREEEDKEERGRR